MAVKLDLPYTLNFILGTMSNKAKLEEATYLGSTESVDLLLDLDMLTEEAKLTKKQSEVVGLYYYEQYTQGEVAEKLGISQQAVLDHLNKAKKRIEKVIERWGNLDAEYSNK